MKIETTLQKLHALAYKETKHPRPIRMLDAVIEHARRIEKEDGISVSDVVSAGVLLFVEQWESERKASKPEDAPSVPGATGLATPEV